MFLLMDTCGGISLRDRVLDAAEGSLSAKGSPTSRLRRSRRTRGSARAVFTLFVVPSIYILLAGRRKPVHHAVANPDTVPTVGLTPA